MRCNAMNLNQDGYDLYQEICNTNTISAERAQFSWFHNIISHKYELSSGHVVIIISHMYILNLTAREIRIFIDHYPKQLQDL